MRKLSISTVAVLVAFAATQVSAASADYTFSGSCDVTGIAKFGKPLTADPADNTYDFHSGDPGDGAGDRTMCDGTLNGQAITDMPAVATVKGPGNLSCGSGESTARGTGLLTFPDGSGFPFGFEFTAVVTEVDFTIFDMNGAEAGTGHASFAKYAGPFAPAECEGIDANQDGTKGLSQLGFEASFETLGTVTAPETTAPPPPPASKCDGLSGKKKKRCLAIEKCKQIENKKKRAKCIAKAKGGGRRG